MDDGQSERYGGLPRAVVRRSGAAILAWCQHRRCDGHDGDRHACLTVIGESEIIADAVVTVTVVLERMDLWESQARKMKEASAMKERTHSGTPVVTGNLSMRRPKARRRKGAVNKTEPAPADPAQQAAVECSLNGDRRALHEKEEESAAECDAARPPSPSGPDTTPGATDADAGNEAASIAADRGGAFSNEAAYAKAEKAAEPARSDVDDDEDSGLLDWKAVAEERRKHMERLLDQPSGASYPVHAPYFPEVSVCAVALRFSPPCVEVFTVHDAAARRSRSTGG